MNFVINKYTSLCNKPSDINEHLPTLFKYAKECNSIFETGVRGVVSSWALLFGLLMNNNNEKKTFIMNDIENCDMDEIFKAAKELNIDIAFKLENNLLIDFVKRRSNISSGGGLLVNPSLPKKSIKRRYYIGI